MIVLYGGLCVFRDLKWKFPNIQTKTIFLDTTDNPRTKKKIVFKTKGTITGIEISANGHIRGTGTLGISYNDTISYKVYNLDTGKIEIVHKSDWYNEKCFVTITQTTKSEGKLKITCNFIGD